MKPVDQTTFGHPGGNCFSACVASLLEIDLAEVPYFMGEDDWFSAFVRWAVTRGFQPVTFKFDQEWCALGLHILGGQSARGAHAVVARGDIVVHDPHPSREGLVAREDVTLLVPLDPARGAP